MITFKEMLGIITEDDSVEFKFTDIEEGKKHLMSTLMRSPIHVNVAYHGYSSVDEETVKRIFRIVEKHDKQAKYNPAVEFDMTLNSTKELKAFLEDLEDELNAPGYNDYGDEWEWQVTVKA